jgi:hypothetical protein
MIENAFFNVAIKLYGSNQRIILLLNAKYSTIFTIAAKIEEVIG